MWVSQCSNALCLFCSVQCVDCGKGSARVSMPERSEGKPHAVTVEQRGTLTTRALATADARDESTLIRTETIEDSDRPRSSQLQTACWDLGELFWEAVSHTSLHLSTTITSAAVCSSLVEKDTR